MTDKELIALAAKAIGLLPEDGLFWNEDGRRWNPLVDDSDAFRLMVELELPTHRDADLAWCAGQRLTIENDQFAVTRRAIVCAAADIGRFQ